ncbi:hypothetical protein [Mangrovicoccus algicola]|uniref:hypothetical protein n=1 Tax=Mangrovicoccus algicola TaxID=2771008 RepID=UPI0018673F93|nr:hypothetical protein [Mangrovicoccus algicola]
MIATVLLAAGGMVPAAGPAAADPAEICGSTAPPTPGYCDCTIGAAQDAGIDGPALEQLLADDWAAIPSDLADRFSLIIVECLRATGAGSEMAAPVLPGGGLDAPMPPTGRDSIAPAIAPVVAPPAITPDPAPDPDPAPPGSGSLDAEEGGRPALAAPGPAPREQEAPGLRIAPMAH